MQAASEDVPTRGSFPPKATPLLDALGDEGTARIRGMSVPELKQLSEEVRWQVLDAVSVTGGHLGGPLRWSRAMYRGLDG